MPAPAVFRSTSPEVLETHRGNVIRGRSATTKWKRFMEETGMEPVITFHPQGAIVSGVYPAPGTDVTAPPPGWFWDPARGLLAPASQKNEGTDRSPGRSVMQQLADMEWTLKALPGIDGVASLHGVTCLDFDNVTARMEAAIVARHGDSAILEINHEVWLMIHQDMAPHVDEEHWERSRRYLLEEAMASS